MAGIYVFHMESKYLRFLSGLCWLNFGRREGWLQWNLDSPYGVNERSGLGIFLDKVWTQEQKFSDLVLDGLGRVMRKV